MEFDYRPAANRSETRFEQVRSISTCLDSSNLLEPSHRPVRSQIPLRYPGHRPGRRPAASWNLAYDALSSSLAELADLRQVCDQSQTCLRPGQRNVIWL